MVSSQALLARRRSWALWVAGAIAAFVVACEPQLRREPLLSCQEQDQYEFEPINPAFWFGFGDETPGAYDGSEDGNVANGDDGLPVRPPAPVVQTLIEPICGFATANFYKTYGHNDWGSAWGSAVRNRDTPYDASEYQGVSFWAKSALSADKTFTVLLETRRTAKPLDAELPDGGTTSDPRDCQSAKLADGAAVYRTLGDGTLQITNSVASPDDCGNNFRALVTTTHRWQLYRIPFEDFWQDALPNRAPGGIDRGAILMFGFRADKEKRLEFSIAGLSFYRKAGWQPDVQAGAMGAALVGAASEFDGGALSPSDAVTDASARAGRDSSAP